MEGTNNTPRLGREFVRAFDSRSLDLPLAKVALPVTGTGGPSQFPYDAILPEEHDRRKQHAGSAPLNTIKE